ncbi:GDSL esterase/lipase At5g55050 isoform X2 [Cryptomeria japonica]|uniref:GDSL esterase/lipase At5g55050 isoform X2 n=1 Tax=Cryptomeria japonica TaxID=3369 RepID=UPI0027D9E1E0|nr:GDSL esterase/lipase At5g55050 isoform X2 [Cryptomeria japonica]
MSSTLWRVALIIVALYVDAQNAQLVPALFIFGDSLVDVGNNNHIRLSLIKANFPHNGVDYPDGKATGRFNNAQKLGFAGSPPAYLFLEGRGNISSSILNGVNFASGGAGILDENSGGSLSMNKQVEYYATVHGNLVAQLGSAEAQKLVAKSLFMVVIGSNDMFSYFESNSKLKAKYTPQQYIDLLISTFKVQLQRIYNLGARRIVSVGVGAVGCCPSQRSKMNKTGDCVEEENNLARSFNTALKSLLASQLTPNLQGFRYALCNTYGVASKYFQNPSVYGFKDVMNACCGAGKLNARIACLPVVKYCSNRREYLFWDLYHPTQIVAQMLVDTFYEGSADHVSPINVKQLVSTSI